MCGRTSIGGRIATRAEHLDVGEHPAGVLFMEVDSPHFAQGRQLESRIRASGCPETEKRPVDGRFLFI
jgi:hypothetical protein